MSDHKASGFTFLEVLIALTILAVAGMGVIKLIQGGQDTLGRTRLVERAEVVALAQLDELESDGVSAILDREGGDPDSPLLWKARAYSMPEGGLYRLQISVFLKKATDPLFVLEKLFIERL